jgi:hypothetical protein
MTGSTAQGPAQVPPLHHPWPKLRRRIDFLLSSDLEGAALWCLPSDTAWLMPV